MWLNFFKNVSLITRACTFRRLYQLVSPLQSHSILWMNTPQRTLKRWLKKKQHFLKANIKLFLTFPYPPFQCHEWKPCFLWHFPWQHSQPNKLLPCSCAAPSAVLVQLFMALGHKPVHIKNSLLWLKGQKKISGLRNHNVVRGNRFDKRCAGTAQIVFTANRNIYISF